MYELHQCLCNCKLQLRLFQQSFLINYFVYRLLIRMSNYRKWQVKGDDENIGSWKGASYRNSVEFDKRRNCRNRVSNHYSNIGFLFATHHLLLFSIFLFLNSAAKQHHCLVQSSTAAQRSLAAFVQTRIRGQLMRPTNFTLVYISRANTVYIVGTSASPTVYVCMFFFSCRCCQNRCIKRTAKRSKTS